MKKVTIIASLIVLLTSCGSNKSKVEPQQPKEAKIIAVYTKPDSTKQIDVMLRIITKKIVFDSVDKKDEIVVDTIWGRPSFMPLVDSAGKPLLDSSGRPVISPMPQYFQISKDSVNWRVEGIDVDSLLKKGK